MGRSSGRGSLFLAPATGVLAGAVAVGVAGAPATAVWSGCVAVAGGLLLAFGIVIAYRRPGEQIAPALSRGLAIAAGWGAAIAALAAVRNAVKANVATLPTAWDWTMARPWLWAVSTVALVTAAVLLHVAVPDRAGREPVLCTRSRGQPRAGVAGLLAVVLLGGVVGGARIGVHAAVAAAGEHASTAGAVLIPSVPARPTRQAWRYIAPAEPERVLSAGAGPLVELSDGVVALDGRTGRPRWQYRRGDGRFDQARVSPGGRTVVLRYAETKDSAGAVLTLDALTGRVRATHLLAGGLDHGGFDDTYPRSRIDQNWALGDTVDLTDSTYLVKEGDEYAVRDLDSRRMLWQARQPGGCSAGRGRAERTLGAAILLLSTCVDPWHPTATSAEVTSYADRTGRATWQQKINFAGGRPSVDVTPSGDGRAIAGQAVGSTETAHVAPEQKNLLIDAANGRVLYSGSAVVGWPDSHAPLLGTGDGQSAVLEVFSGHSYPVPDTVSILCTGDAAEYLDSSLREQPQAVRVPSGIACLDTGDDAKNSTYRARGSWPVTTVALPVWRTTGQVSADFGSSKSGSARPFLVRTPGAITVCLNARRGLDRTIVGLA